MLTGTASVTEKFMNDNEQIEEVTQTIEDEIEAMEKQLEALNELKRQKVQDEAEENNLWAQRVHLARALQRKKAQGRAELRRLSKISPARQVHLRKNGKL